MSLELKKPPIVEAIAAVHFSDSPLSEEQQGSLAQALSTFYGGEKRETIPFMIDFQLKGGDISAGARKDQAKRYLLVNEDRDAAVGIGLADLSVHVMAPYPGWTSFEHRIQQALDMLSSEVGNRSWTRVELRYMDRIAVPQSEEPAPMHEYFPIVPPRGKGWPPTLQSFTSQFRLVDPATAVVANMSYTAVPPQDGESAAMVYDVNLVQIRRDTDGEDVIDVLSRLNGQHTDIFESTLTERTLELFQ